MSLQYRSNLFYQKFLLFYFVCLESCFCPSEADPPLAENRDFILSQNSIRIPINSKPTKINHDPGVNGVKSATRPIIINKNPTAFLKAGFIIFVCVYAQWRGFLFHQNPDDGLFRAILPHRPIVSISFHRDRLILLLFLKYSSFFRDVFRVVYFYATLL